MTMQEVDIGHSLEQEIKIGHSFEHEVFFSLRKQRNSWAIVACFCLALSIACIALLVVILPLKEVKPYLVLVDKTTGEAERVVQVAPLQLSEQEAVIQAELVRYVSDRETYDVSDNDVRIPDLLKRSDKQAAVSLRSLWNSSNPEYPPEIYADDKQVLVKILSATNLDKNTAQVRFRKTLVQEGVDDVNRDFVATVTFEFRPRVERNLELVWHNPLGFTVTDYRIDAETLSNR